MSNEEWNRFQRTLSYLWGCKNHWWDEGLSPVETEAREKMLKLCKRIVEESE